MCIDNELYYIAWLSCHLLESLAVAYAFPHLFPPQNWKLTISPRSRTVPQNRVPCMSSFHFPSPPATPKTNKLVQTIEPFCELI